MTMIMDIKEDYLAQFQHFINSLLKDAIVVKQSLDVEITKRIKEYQDGDMKSVPFEQGLSQMRQSMK